MRGAGRVPRVSRTGDPQSAEGEAAPVEPPCDVAQRHRRCVDQIHGRDALIRPLVRCEGGTATPRAQAPPTPPQTVRTLTRHLAQQGLLGLLPNPLDVRPPRRGRQVPEAVVEEIARLTALSAG
jgi:hypothetical protein